MTELPPEPERNAADDPHHWDKVEKLYRDHQTAARHAAGWILGSPHDPEIEDVIHDSVVKAYRALHTLQDPEKARGWFLTIVSHQALDYRRTRSRRSRKESIDGSVEELQLASHGLLPEEFQMLRVGLEFVDTLPEHQRVAYLLEHFIGLDREGIAEVLGCSPKTVGTHLRRAQDKADKKFSPAVDPTNEVQRARLRRRTA